MEKVREAVATEFDGPSKLIGYRLIKKKIQINHRLNVPRDFGLCTMRKDLYAEGIEAKTPAAKKKKEQDISQPRALSGFTQLMATTSLWGTRTAPTLSLYVAQLILPAEDYYGFKSG